MPKLHISAVVEVADGAREQARVMSLLENAAHGLEVAILEATELQATVEMRVVKHKETKAAPVVAPASTGE